MDGGTLYTIGDLARRTGLPVKTIRFYSDRGIVPPVERSPAGYRLYDAAAAARLDLVRTLRDLGVDLATVRKVVDRELTLTQVAAAHAEALGVRIRTLRLRRAVLTAVARRGSGPEEMELMHRLAGLSEDERRRLVGDFLDAAVPDAGPGLAGIRVSMTPELPDDAEPEQVEAWVELAELMADPSFRTTMHTLTTSHTTDRASSAPALAPESASAPAADRASSTPAPATDGGGGVRRDAVSLGLGPAGAALAAGVDPAAPEAAPVVAAVAGEYARLLGLPDDAALRRRLLTRLETANDPRRERYLQLLAVINAWPPPAPTTPALDWLLTALRTHPSP
ncbi:MerR family transcriptional regulator [Nonomuraea sp. NPDC052265]|uniref:MerR family transcriptional regulator n=1 Tax=Nonomuraea sp. NPDC052265 TaxID=3364374 RepID=UPI0037CB91B7